MGHGSEPMPAEVIEVMKRPGYASPLIYAAMIEAMRLVKAVGKEGFNEQQKYKFRGIDGVLDAVGPALREAGVFVTSEILEIKYRDTRTTGDKPTREVTARIRYTFHATDGSSVSTEVAGESLDQSDKGTAKAFSVALRIALLQTLALPTQEPTTDDTGQYHTRGNDSLSSWTRRYGQSLLTAEVPDVKTIMEFWPAIVEASQTDAVVSGGEAGVTWHELIAETLGRAIASVTTAEEGRALHAILKPSGALHWMYEGQKLGDRMIARAAQIKINQVKAFDHCMALILAAEDDAALFAALEHIQADLENGPLTPEQHNELINVASERQKKITPRREYLPPVGYAWERFVEFADRQNLTEAEIRSMLEGQWDKDAEAPAAHEFGLNGLIRLADAVKRSNARDHTVGITDRANLLQLIRDTAYENEIEISEANL